jgi:hypothetical protein
MLHELKNLANFISSIVNRRIKGWPFLRFNVFGIRFELNFVAYYQHNYSGNFIEFANFK